MKGIEILSGGKLLSWLAGGTKQETRAILKRYPTASVTIRKNGKTTFIGTAANY